MDATDGQKVTAELTGEPLTIDTSLSPPPRRYFRADTSRLPAMAESLVLLSHGCVCKDQAHGHHESDVIAATTWRRMQ